MKDKKPPQDAREVSDVLNSIRQMVSDEVKIGADAADAPAVAAPLSLTGAMRVDKAPQEAEATEVKAAETTPPLMLTPDMADEPAAAGDAADDLTADDATAADDIAEDDTVVEQETPAASPYFDEAELRAIVAEMVQDELQGQLGERITHNIRKIVRREVARAMDLEGDEGTITS